MSLLTVSVSATFPSISTLANHLMTGMERDSTELVPGDIINLSRSHITMFPADMFLLSGDAIVNESMLTGESVPVSKIPAKDDDLVQWREQKEESGKSFLYAGTRIIRIRGVMTADGTSGRPALAMVVRTGMCTENIDGVEPDDPQASIQRRARLSGRCCTPSLLGSSSIATPSALSAFSQVSQAWASLSAQ